MVPVIQEAQAVRVTTEENTNLYMSSNEVLKDRLGALLCLFYVFIYSFTWSRRLPLKPGQEKPQSKLFSVSSLKGPY